MGRGSSKAGTKTGRSQPVGRGSGMAFTYGVPRSYTDAVDRRRQAALMDDMNDEYSEAIAFASDGMYPNGELMDADVRDLNSIVANGLLNGDYNSGAEFREAVSDVLGGLKDHELKDVQAALRNHTEPIFRNMAQTSTGRLKDYYEDMATMADFAADMMNDDFGQRGVRLRRR